MGQEPPACDTLLLSVFLMTALTSSQTLKNKKTGSCPNGWFGENCTYLCHCTGGYQCLQTSGDCPPNISCLAGMFGPACQYVDLLAELASPDNPTFLTDRKRTTCNPDSSSTSMTITLKHSIQFTWMRVYTNMDVSDQDLSVQLDTEFCPARRMFRVSEQIMDVSCDSTLLTDQIHLLGHIVGHICHLQISGGRNVAIKQKAHQSSNLEFVDRYRAPVAVDGSRESSFVNNSCSYTPMDPVDPFWILEYHRPQRISRVVIYNRDAYSYRLSGFVLELYHLSHNKTPHFVHKDDPHFVRLVYDIHVPGSGQPVDFLKIWFSRKEPRDNNILSLCEVETYGETVCPAGRLGLYCQGTCKCQPNEQCSLVTGVCGTSCVAEGNELRCSYPCHDNCLDHQCRDGMCISCQAGFFGPLCEKACPPGKFGLDCSDSCSTSCQEGICNSSTGHCYACKGQQLMPWCEQEAFKWRYLLPLLLLLPLSMCLLCCLLRKKKTSQSVPEAEPPIPEPADVRVSHIPSSEELEEVMQRGSSVDLAIEESGSEAGSSVVD